MKAKKGFTLVEILIVVVILGILAAIVIPQFTSASSEAKFSALVSDLQAVRSQVQLFKIHHNDILPGSALLTGGATFIECMTGTTDQYGDPLGTDFGPYMRKVPANPFSTLDKDAQGNGTVDETGVIGNNGGHWEWDSVTGLFSADDNWDQDPADGISDHADL